MLSAKRIRPPCMVLLALLLAVVCSDHPSFAQDSAQDPQSKHLWAIALHGGAGSIAKDLAPERVDAYRRSLEAALKAGTDALSDKGTALDAVQATVVALENNPLFNAGRGSVFHAKGGHQLDASIMDGETRRGQVRRHTWRRNLGRITEAIDERAESPCFDLLR